MVQGIMNFYEYICNGENIQYELLVWNFILCFSHELSLTYHWTWINVEETFKHLAIAFFLIQ